MRSRRSSRPLGGQWFLRPRPGAPPTPEPRPPPGLLERRASLLDSGWETEVRARKSEVESKHELSGRYEDGGVRLSGTRTPTPPRLHQRRGQHQSCLPANNRETPTTFPFLSSPCGTGGLGAWPPGNPSPPPPPPVLLKDFVLSQQSGGTFQRNAQLRKTSSGLLTFLFPVSGVSSLGSSTSPVSCPAAVPVPCSPPEQTERYGS